MQKITPFLWFDTRAEEAVQFYVNLFSRRRGAVKKSRIVKIVRYTDASGKAAGMPGGTAMVVNFLLDGQEFVALNGGPVFKFTEAVSFVIDCKTQKEVDYFWDKLCEEGTPSQCGWLKDKFGLSWQVVPTELNKLLSQKDPKKANKAMMAMLKMTKIDIDAIKKASRS